MEKLAQEEAAKSHFVQHTRTSTSGRNRPNTKKKCRKKKKGLTQQTSASHTGLLLSPQLQQSRTHQGTKHTHFTQGTFNSVWRQQPPVVHMAPFSIPTPAVCSTPAYQGTPRPCQLVLACSPTPSGSHKEMIKKTSKKSLGLVRKKAESPLHPEKEPLWHDEVEISLDCDYDNEEENVDENTTDLPSQPPVPTDSLSSAIAEQANQLKFLRLDISQKLTELKVGMLSSTNTAPVALKHFPHLPDTKVSSMMQRLDELVAEEDEIRQRWTSIVYEDPLHTKPRHLFNHKRKQNPSGDKPMTLPYLPTQNKEELDEYRQRYAHYLACTGQSTQGESSPWKMAER